MYFIKVITETIARLIGYQLIYNIEANEKYIQTFSASLGIQNSDSITERELQLNNWDHGPSVGISYQLNNSFQLCSNFYYGLTNLLPDDTPYTGWQRKNRQLTIGINYLIEGKNNG